MRFVPEPEYRHGAAAKAGILLVNLGTPDAPTPKALNRYLAQFLRDPRVVEIPRLLWWPILHGIILRTRPRASAKKYAAIWTPQGSPLVVQSEALRAGISTTLGTTPVALAMLDAGRGGRSLVDSVPALDLVAWSVGDGHLHLRSELGYALGVEGRR